MRCCQALSCIQLVTLVGLCSAFIPHSQTSLPGRTSTWSTSREKTKLPMFVLRRSYKDLEWKKPSDEQVAHWLQQYGEVSRYYRQDVFDAGDWVRARRPTRFVGNIMSTWKSGLIRQISLYISVLAMCSGFVVMYNNLYLSKGLPFGLGRWLSPLKIPVLPFNLAAASLGLLLTFRTNVCYQRWNEARSAWGKIINDSRSLARMGCIWGQSYSKNVSPSVLRRLGEAICSFSRTVMNRTLPRPEDESHFVKYCQTHLSDEVYASNLYNSDHRPTRALAEISAILVHLNLDPLHQIQIEGMVSELCSALGVCERILTSPIPTFYSRHTSRFLAFWLFFLPMALYDSITGWNHFAMVPIMIVLGGFMLGIEELSCQLEEPFSILPMEKMTEDSIRKTVMDQVERSSQHLEDDHALANSTDHIKSIDNKLSVNGVVSSEDDTTDSHLERPPSTGRSNTSINGKKTIATGTELFDNL